MFRDTYRHMNDQIAPSSQLISKVLDSADTVKRTHGLRKTRIRKPAIILAALFICTFAAVPVLAANMPAAYELLYLVSPSTAQFFIPIKRSSEDNGIKMEVVSAYIHENTAEIQITMQDLTGDRIDETIDLYNSYSIRRPFDSSAHCQLIGYDEVTKTATFLISITEWGNQKITDDKITFSVNEFLSHKKTYDGIPIPTDLSLIQTALDTQSVNSTGGGGHDYERLAGEKPPTALIPSEPMKGFPVDGIDFTGIGYIDGMLHIQTAVSDPLNNDNHGYFYLKDGDGNKIDCNYSFSFLNQFEQSGRINYCEYVFDIPQDRISQYSLYGHFVTSGLLTSGKWQVTFPLEKETSTQNFI